jgi:hypothetical protein
MANKEGNGWRIPLQTLENKPYVCRCGTKYQTRMQDTHWHLEMEIPSSLLNHEELRKILEKNKGMK